MPRWYWIFQEEKEGKKYVSKSDGTREGSFNEHFTRIASKKYKNVYDKNVGNSTESVFSGNEACTRSVDIQADASIFKNVEKYGHEGVLHDDEDLEENIHGEENSNRKMRKKLMKRKKEEFKEFTW